MLFVFKLLTVPARWVGAWVGVLIATIFWVVAVRWGCEYFAPSVMLQGHTLQLQGFNLEYTWCGVLQVVVGFLAFYSGYSED